MDKPKIYDPIEINNLVFNEKIITDSDIKYVLFSSLTIPSNYYNELIDYTYNFKRSQIAH